MKRLKKVAKKDFNRSKPDRKGTNFNRSEPKEENAESNHSDFITDFKEEKFLFTWRIENVHRCTLKCREFLETPTFSTRFCSEVKWALWFYPRGRELSKNFQLNKTCSEMNFFYNSTDCEKVGLFIRKISAIPEKSTFRYRLSCERLLLNTTKQTKIYRYPSRGLSEIKMDSTSTDDLHGTDDLYCPEDFEYPEILLVRCTIYATNVFNTRASGNDFAGEL